jgi:hypothetical protein
MSTTNSENQPPTGAGALCDLLVGHLADWRGLVPFSRDSIPTCFGTRVESGQKTWSYLDWQFQRFNGGHSDAWFFGQDATVSLVDIVLAPTMDAAQMEAALGPPPWMREVTGDESLEPAFNDGGSDVRCDREAVYAARGIAFLLTAGDAARVRRIRVFPPVDRRTYARRFVPRRSIIWMDP